ncbi:hypothetical protein NPIL_41721 [Nephila pilipes]|uniref:Uncharacterized protein n=1 Tax=Nephila pilipes TaxID=299642 RepID=A0A8X6NIV9_NEPPI|nr:hypothetical protein NPIL_41721 [Nephila pilipes]
MVFRLIKYTVEDWVRGAHKSIVVKMESMKGEVAILTKELRQSATFTVKISAMVDDNFAVKATYGWVIKDVFLVLKRIGTAVTICAHRSFDIYKVSNGNGFRNLQDLF